MSTQVTQTGSAEMENSQTNIEAAYEAVGDALQELDLTEHRDQWTALQKQYFDLKAAVLARDGDFQQMDLGGTEVSVPSVHHHSVENPTTEDELGEVELPTKNDSFRVLDGVRVADPENPHVTHGVTVDHVIETDGEVTLEINAVPLEEVGTREGSHTR